MTDNQNIITRISNELGNQMFMYASTLGISKRINKTLLLEFKVNRFARTHPAEPAPIII